MLRLLACLLLFCVLVLLAFSLFQRSLLYHPSHNLRSSNADGLVEWKTDKGVLGCAREVASPKGVWLLIHGNAGQAEDRAYALPCFSSEDSVFILEYPGYGSRKGSPSKSSFDQAAIQAYEILRTRFPSIPIGVAGESIGTGPASQLATVPRPPDKIVLIVPFDVLARVASHHYPFLPASLILRDNWNNIASLKDYQGKVEIFAAREDEIIPVERARALASSKTGIVLHEIEGGHNEWSAGGQVKIRFR